MTALETDWQKFSAGVIPTGASAEQRQATRDAFFGGAWIAFQIIHEISAVTRDEDVAILKVDAFKKELEQYFADRKAGRI